MLKTCPRCKQSFECCVNDISQCHCVSVAIDADTLAVLKEEFDDCLCDVCLKSLNNKSLQKLILQ